MNRTERRRDARTAEASRSPSIGVALDHYRAGRLAEAHNACEAVLRLDPSHTDALNLQGLVAQRLGDLPTAERLLRRAVQSHPTNVAYLVNLGNVLQDLGVPVEAAALFRRAIAADATADTAWFNLGNALGRQGEAAEAERCYRQVLALRPQHAHATLNLANALVRLHRPAEAVDLYHSLLAGNPGNPQVLTNLASALRAAGRAGEATAYVVQAIEAEPGYSHGYHVMGQVFQDFNRLDDAAAALGQAVQLAPTNAAALADLGLLQRLRGEPDAAIAALQRSLAIVPSAAVAMRAATTLPIIPASVAEAAEYRARMVAALDELLAAPGAIADPTTDVAATNFYAAYQGENDRDLQVQLAEAWRHVCPSLFDDLTPPRTAPSHGGERIRVGFASRYLGNHTIGKFVRGFVQQLDRERFEVAVIHLGGSPDAASAALDTTADLSLRPTGPLAEVRSQVAALGLDVLCYPDVGMDPLTTYLAYARLAPVQCALWGHPVTTGSPHIDYFLSADGLEPADADSHYRERLVRLSRLPTYYQAPTAPAVVSPGTDLAPGHEESRWYVCPHSLFKLHPDFDRMLAELLHADPQGELFLLEGVSANWTQRLLARFAATDDELAERTVVLPRMAEPQFLSLLLHADALLDPLHFGGGNTTYEAFAVGAPIVTLPGAYMRGRVTAAAYRQMGVDGPIATTTHEYVDLALRLAHEPAYRAGVSTALLSHRDHLFEDAAAVRELEGFFTTAHRMAHSTTLEVRP